MVKKFKGFIWVTKVTGEKIKRIKIWKIREFGGLTWRQRRRTSEGLGTEDDPGAEMNWQQWMTQDGLDGLA